MIPINVARMVRSRIGDIRVAGSGLLRREVAMTGIGPSGRFSTTWLVGIAGAMLLATVLSGIACAVEHGDPGPDGASSHATAQHGDSRHHHPARKGAFGQSVDHCQSILADLDEVPAVPTGSGSGDPAPAAALSALLMQADAAAGGLVGPMLTDASSWRPPPIVLMTARMRL